MDRERLEYFKEKLLEEREEQVRSLENREEETKESQKLLDNELSSYDNHPADTGTELYMMEQERGFAEQIKDIIDEIDESLEDIENEDYGICIDCDEEIDEERLELIPYAKTCLECSEKEEVIEDYEDEEEIFESLNYESFSLEEKEDKDDVEYDGEDVYGDVLEDNIVPGDPSHSTGDNMGLVDENTEETNTAEEIEKISDEYYEDTIE